MPPEVRKKLKRIVRRKKKVDPETTVESKEVIAKKEKAPVKKTSIKKVESKPLSGKTVKKVEPKSLPEKEIKTSSQKTEMKVLPRKVRSRVTKKKDKIVVVKLKKDKENIIAEYDYNKKDKLGLEKISDEAYSHFKELCGTRERNSFAVIKKENCAGDIST